MTGSPAKIKKLPFLAALLLMLLGSGCANGIFYQPSRRMAAAPDSRELQYEAVNFRSADGTALTGWWLPANGEPKGTVIHFHGNAQNMSTHVQYAEWLPAAGYNLFVFDYRGYGRSGGTPNRKGVIRDGVAALTTVHARSDIDKTKLYVWGQSLGGTVALQSMVHTNIPVQAAIIDSTFYSFSKIAADKMRQFPWFLQPLRLFRPLLISPGYDASSAVKELPALPLFFIHGENDRVIPASHSQKLHTLAPDHAGLWIIPGAGHCDAVLRFPEKVRPRILQFLEAPLQVTSPK
ncbi:alpha/beta hydrolase [Kiritimatiellaeota bacterium B1221]|nr:alpha/beta hydrolase [Kiritimatiellaeota bacterium B1221]